MKHIRRLHAHITASDPGNLNLRNGLIPTLSLLFSMGAMQLAGTLFHFLKPMMLIAVLASGLVGIMAPVVITDTSIVDQKKSALAVMPAIALSAALGALVSSNALLGMLLFLPIIFLSIFLKHYGVRGQAIGMLSYISYFLSLMFHVQLAQLGGVCGALLAGSVISSFVRFVLLPEKPLNKFMHIGRSYCTQVLVILAGSRRLKTSRVKALLMRLKETGLELDTQSGFAELGFDDASRTKLRLLLMNVEAAAGAMILRGAEAAELKKNLEKFDSFLSTLPQICKGSQKVHATPAAAAVVEAKSSMAADVRLAVQATLAASISMGIGWKISPQRWYWAVIASFVIFSSTTTRGDVINKAWNRAFGTLIGLAIGQILVLFIAGHTQIELVTITLSIFFAFYMMRVGPFWLIFGFSILLAILYDMMGTFSSELMELRLIETVCGALIGGLVSLFIMPIPTRPKISDFTDRLQKGAMSLAEKMDSLRGNPNAPITPCSVLDDMRRLDRLFFDLRKTALPLLSRTAFHKRKAAQRLIESTEEIIFMMRARVLQFISNPADAAEPAPVQLNQFLIDLPALAAAL